MSASWYALVTLISRGFFVGRVLNVLDHLQCLQSGRHDDAQTLIAALPFGNWDGIVLRPVLHGAAAQATGIGAGSCRGEIMVDKIGQSWEAVNRQLASQGLAGDARQKSVQPPMQATNRSPIFDMEPISRRGCLSTCIELC